VIDDASADPFLASAQRALRSTGGAAALDALGWWELLADLHDTGDDDARAAVFALFRAQGRELASTPALGGLLAAPFLAGTDLAPGAVLATVRRRSPRRGAVRVVVGDPGGRDLLVDEPGAGAGLVGSAECELVPVDVPGRLVVHEVRLDEAPVRPFLDEPIAATAVEHACAREQFGRPIGTFQAVRHLLAWARTDCVALDAVVRQAVELDAAAPARFDAIVKALAGRNGARACQRSLQVLGGIGFTAEHDHHHHASRVMLLDALLGTGAELRHELGRWLRTGASDPGLAEAMLLGRAGSPAPAP
jgi:hypothetical protein